MLRSFFILLSKAHWAQKLIMSLGFARKMATRFVAGEELMDAIKVVQNLNAKGILATLDHLGENTTTQAEAETATQVIVSILDALSQNALKSNVSIKLSQIGFSLGETICLRNLRTILSAGKEKNIFVRIDMEDSSTVDKTIAYYFQMKKEGYEKVGLVIQACLYRSESDIAELLTANTPIRLCKGAYKEPPEVAFPKKPNVDRNYDRLTQMLMKASKETGSKGSENGCVPPIPAIATHDEERIRNAKSYADEIGITKDGFEFQMLYGIRRDLQESLKQDGYQVRIYVPYGNQWYPYFMRRLAERPANVWFFISNYFKN